MRTLTRIREAPSTEQLGFHSRRSLSVSRPSSLSEARVSRPWPCAACSAVRGRLAPCCPEDSLAEGRLVELAMLDISASRSRPGWAGLAAAGAGAAFCAGAGSGGAGLTWAGTLGAAAAAPKVPAQVKPAPPEPAPAQKAAPAPAAAKPAQPGLDLDALMSSIASSTKRPSARESSGQQGANRPRTAEQAAQGQGRDTRASDSELGLLTDKLRRLWNPNCSVEGASRILVKVRIRLTPDGRLAAPPELQNAGALQGDAMLQAAGQRAVSAVGRGAPYTELNPEHYEGWRDIVVNFDGKKACAGK